MKKILIIDDEEILLRTFSRLLEKYGYHTILAKSGLDAFVKVSRNVFDIILCDLKMPGINGLDTLIKLKGIWRLRNMEIPPIIAMSGDYEHERDEKIQEVGARAYLIKPFGAHELLQCLDACLGSQVPSEANPPAAAKSLSFRSR